MHPDIASQHQSIFDRHAGEYDARTSGAHARYLGPFITAFADAVGRGCVLDLGCASGRDLAYFARRSLSAKGMDFSPKMIDICRERGHDASCGNFLDGTWQETTWNGIWAYTSLSLVPKAEMKEILDGARRSLVPHQGVLGLGLIEGSGEGWKRDSKYGGESRYVARYSMTELRGLLSSYFGRVVLNRVVDPDSPTRAYIHAICWNVPPVSMEDTGKMAAALFDVYGEDYERRTMMGAEAVRQELELFASFLRPSAKILDLGSGPGRDALALRAVGLNPVCLDIASWNVARCRARGLAATLGNIECADTLFCPGEFDGAWSNCALTNWLPMSSMRRGLSAMNSVVGRNGLLFIGSVLGGFVGLEKDDKYGRLPRHNQHWDEEELRVLLSTVGDIISWRVEDASHIGKKQYAYAVLRTRAN